MNLWWLIGFFLGAYTSLYLFFWISGRRYDRKSEKTKEKIIEEIQSFDFESQRILKKHFDCLQSPEYKRLREDTLREMENDDLYKSVH